MNSKVPTLLLYRKGSTQLVHWGMDARRRIMKPGSGDLLLLYNFRLYLDEYLQEEVLPSNLQIVDVITDYLHSFHQHACAEICTNTLGVSYDQSQFRYFLTVPTTWNDRAKAIMREASIRAGLVKRGDHPDRLILVSETQAAVSYCQRKLTLAHGQRFMICDAGGSTVDLTVFEIDKQKNGRRLYKELASNSCGSGSLNLRMRNYIKRRFYHFINISEKAMMDIMDEFVDLLKPGFDGSEDQYLVLPESMSCENLTDEDFKAIGTKDYNLTLPVNELKEQVFDPVVDPVLQLITEQLAQSPDCLDAIFLIGSLSKSIYLYRRAEEMFSNRVGMIKVPPRSELAYSRGATYFGLDQL
ncbi:hypothetical protein BJV82DRAFT_613072 [Fennellomyces sp. T-0311]|nr:hypothetical protein BJV82DRAFT_613072 [Fennellomyces sp. T-0311]